MLPESLRAVAVVIGAAGVAGTSLIGAIASVRAHREVRAPDGTAPTGETVAAMSEALALHMKAPCSPACGAHPANTASVAASALTPGIGAA